MIRSNGDADGRQYPDEGLGSDAYYDAFTNENYTDTEEAYARYDLTDDSKIQGRSGIDAGERRERPSADAYKDTGPYADRLSRQLHLKADYRSGNHHA